MQQPSWNFGDTELAAFQFAEWLVINHGSSENFVDEYETDLEGAWSAAEARGWVETIHPDTREPRRLGDTLRQPTAKVTGNGRLRVDEVRKLRGSRSARQSVCRDAILLWLADALPQQESMEPFLRSQFRYYGTPFTEDEVAGACDFLTEVGLMRGVFTFGGLALPELTARGRQCVEYADGDVRQFLNPKQGGHVTYTQNINGPVHGQVGQGETVNQTQNSGIDAAALAVIFETMRDALSSVEDSDDRDDVSHAIDELEAATQDGHPELVYERAGRLKRLGNRVGLTASNAAITTATAAGTTGILHAFDLG